MSTGHIVGPHCNNDDHLAGGMIGTALLPFSERRSLMTRTPLMAAAAASLAFLAACADTAPLSPEVAGSSSSRSQAADQVMEGQVIVKVADDNDFSAVAREHGLAVGEALGLKHLYVMHGAIGREHANAAALRGDNRVLYAEPNYLRQPTTINPNLWAFRNPGGLNMKYTS